jgi:phosphopentomutase
MDQLVERGYPVVGIGKIRDIYAGRGVTRHVKATNNADILARTIEVTREGGRGLVFANLVDFDMLYGHRRDPAGFAGALKAFDLRLDELLAALHPTDLLVLTADHGNDPTFPGTDHCREYVPLLVYRPGLEHGGPLGTRGAFADIAATVAEVFGLPGTGVGVSFLPEVC